MYRRERESKNNGWLLYTTFWSYPDAEGKDLENALHCEHASKAPVEVLKRFGVELALLVKLLKHIQHVAKLSNKLL